jgi:hypothetical protein
MPGGKGKSTGGKAGPKEAAGKSQKSHSAKAGLQVRITNTFSSRLRDQGPSQCYSINATRLAIEHGNH